MRKIIIGVMGSWSSNENENENAEILGRLITESGWNVLCGGGNKGVMHFVAKGANEAGGDVVGISSGTPKNNDMSEYVTIPLYTGMGSGRNYLNILSSDIIIAASNLSAGTNSEVALALTENKTVILMSESESDRNFYKNKNPHLVFFADSPEDAIHIVKKILSKKNNL